jgi:hypothetical protein
MSNNFSNIDELIKNDNPFVGHTVVRPEQIWGKSFPDASTINAHASDAVFHAVEQINQEKLSTIGMTITAEKGLGKSHIISRIRHKLQAENTGLLIYMSRYDHLKNLKYQFLQNIISSLRENGSQNAMQLQELATDLINKAKKSSYTPQQYIDTFPIWLHKYSSKVIDHLTETILSFTTNIQNPYIIRALIWTLSPQHSIYATHWLSAGELTPKQSEVLGLPNINKANREDESFNIACQIIDMISYYKVPVICFDELDIIASDKTDYTPAMLVASLAKDLYTNIRKGVLLLTMYPETWKYQVKVLPQAEAVIDRIGGEPIDLNYLTGEDIMAIVSQWLQQFYTENNVIPPHAVYPFNPEQLQQFGEEKPTVRAVLKWCADNFFIAEENLEEVTEIDDYMPVKQENPEEIQNSPINIETPHIVTTAYENELASVRESIDTWIEDNAAIADALYLAFYTIIGKEIEGVKFTEIGGFDIKPCYIDFKLIGIENEQIIKIGVAILQQNSGVNINQTLQQLIDYETLDITRGCLIRSNHFDANDQESQSYLMKLVKEKEGQWVILEKEDIIPLLAIRFVYDNNENYHLTEDEIFDFINQKGLASNNLLVREIISYKFFCTKVTLAFDLGD